MAAMDQLTNLATLMQTVQGSEQTQKQKSSSTQTTQTNVSDAGVNKLIQDILSGPGGVRSVGGAARQTGLFNSTTEDMLLGDLFSRAAVSAELARSPTTVNTSGSQTVTTETPGVGLGGIGGAIALAQGGKLLFGQGGKGGLLEGAGDAISNLFGGGGAAAAGSAVTPAVTTGASSALAGATGSAAVNAGVAGTAGGALSSLGTSGASAAGGAAAGQGLGMNMSTAIPLGGSFLSGLIGGKDAATEPGSLAMSAMAGAMALGPIGLIAAPLAAIAGGFLKDMSVICTALHRKGLISGHLHHKGDKYFALVPPVTKVGYWLWGVWVARKITAGSVFWTRLCLPITKSYLRYISGSSAISEPLGAVTHYVGEPLCNLLGRAAILWETRLKTYN